MSNNQMIGALTILLGIMIFILFILCGVFVTLKIRANKYKPSKNKSKSKNINTETPEHKEKNVVAKSYSKHSVFEFMEFDKIEDNMIIQNDGKRYLMVIGCQGINYDLMSGLEKNSVEQGFLQFLNTLRYPVQIYVQTRTVNLSGSINTYRGRIDDISRQYANKQMEYNQKVRSGQYSDEELAKEKFELVRQRNLYEYGVDIINNTEKMSLNRNILSKHYYIILSYYPEELGNGDFDKEELLNISFSELYTKAQSIISSLSVCGIKSKVLNSMELTELLYIAYNRDEAETFDLRKALNSGYEDLYSTAPDVFSKRIKELDLKIEEEAIKTANEAIFETMEETEKEKKAKQKERELDKLINQMAKALIEENKRSIGTDIAEDAIDKIDQKYKKVKKEKGGDKDGKVSKTANRKNTKSI